MEHKIHVWNHPLGCLSPRFYRWNFDFSPRDRTYRQALRGDWPRGNGIPPHCNDLNAWSEDIRRPIRNEAGKCPGRFAMSLPGMNLRFSRHCLPWEIQKYHVSGNTWNLHQPLSVPVGLKFHPRSFHELPLLRNDVIWFCGPLARTLLSTMFLAVDELRISKSNLGQWRRGCLIQISSCGTRSQKWFSQKNMRFKFNTPVRVTFPLLHLLSVCFFQNNVGSISTVRVTTLMKHVATSQWVTSFGWQFLQLRCPPAPDNLRIINPQ